MKIVVTGALGHIGSRLIRTLPDQFPDATFVLVDNMAAQRYCSLFDLPPGIDFRFIEADVVHDDPSEWLEGADVCVHLAAITDATSSFDRAQEVEEVNLTGAERVARACAMSDVAMIFVSTTSVYGPQGDEVDEYCDDNDLAPQSPYAEAKLRAEQRLAQIAAENGLRYVVFRFGTIFGISPGMRFHTAVNKFCWLASLGRPLTVWRTAYDQRRPYLDLEDAVSAIQFAIKNEMFDNSVYNVVTANLTVRDVVDIIRASLPETRVDFVDAEIMNQHSYSVSAARLGSRGFEATGDPRRAIGATLSLLGGVKGAPVIKPSAG